jgi:hypothetical protein
MKTVRAMASVRSSKFKKRAKVKRVAAADIVQSYTKLLWLRRRVHELEQDKGLPGTRAPSDRRVTDCRFDV